MKKILTAAVPVIFILAIIVAVLLFVFIFQQQMLPSAAADNQPPETSQAERADEEPPSPTPFQPSSPTPTSLPTLTPTPTTTPLPTAPPPEADLPYNKLFPPVYEQDYLPMPMITEPEGQITILILGTDLLPGRRGYRTDGIILATVNTRQQTVSLTSFPRDLYVLIPGWMLQRINTAYPHGGFEMMADTMEYNFGVRPDYYILMHLTFLEEVVDSLGGIWVDVDESICSWRGDIHQDYCVQAGRVFMDGPTAMWYARTRNTAENDFGRNRRHQIVLRAVFNRMMELNSLTKVPQLYKNYLDNVETNLNLGTILSLIPTASKLRDTSRITQYYITKNDVIGWTTFRGAMVLIPQPRPIRDILLQALNSPGK